MVTAAATLWGQRQTHKSRAHTPARAAAQAAQRTQQQQHPHERNTRRYNRPAPAPTPIETSVKDHGAPPCRGASGYQGTTARATAPTIVRLATHYWGAGPRRSRRRARHVLQVIRHEPPQTQDRGHKPHKGPSSSSGPTDAPPPALPKISAERAAPPGERDRHEPERAAERVG